MSPSTALTQLSTFPHMELKQVGEQQSCVSALIRGTEKPPCTSVAVACSTPLQSHPPTVQTPKAVRPCRRTITHLEASVVEEKTSTLASVCVLRLFLLRPNAPPGSKHQHTHFSASQPTVGGGVRGRGAVIRLSCSA